MRAALLALAALAAIALPRLARADLQRLGGEVCVGGAKLFVSGAPGGSMSFAAGVDYPVAEHWTVGPEVGFHLLGTRNVDNGGSFTAAVDYSVFEASLFAHWHPELGPLRRVSLGPSVISARAALSAGAGGAAFLPYAVDEVAPGFGTGVAFLAGGTSVVHAGIEAGLRVGYLRHETWTLGLARLIVTF